MADIEIKRGYEVLPDNNVRFGIRITNTSGLAISDVEVTFDYIKSLFDLEGNRIQNLGNIPPERTHTAEFILKPLGCVHEVNIEALISYRDAKWNRQRVDMAPKEVHCVCPFLKGKKITKAEFLDLSKTGHSTEIGFNFRGVDAERLVSYLVQTCRNRHYKVDDLSVDDGRLLYLASESIGEKAYYLLTALIKEDDGLTQVMLRVVSDKSHGLSGFLSETVAELRHVVSTVQSAQEIGVVKKEQVINIIDSVVQRSSFGGSGGDGAASVNIEGSLVQRTEFNAGEDSMVEEERLRGEGEEQKQQEREQKALLLKQHNERQKPKPKSRKNVFMFAIVIGALLVGFMLFPADSGEIADISSTSISESVSESIEPTSSQQSEVEPESVPESIEPTPSQQSEVESEVSQTLAPSSNQKASTNSIGMEFVLIPAGEFDMGSPSGETDRYGDEGPVHKVKISDAFYLGKYEVTQKQWREIMGDNPSNYDGDNRPVEYVSWNDAQDFIKKLNTKESTDKYRLPSEAEWEYAARAGSTTRYSFGDIESRLGEYGWYEGNSGDKTHLVGQKKPNPWGLYDMHGNVWEWTQDLYNGDYKVAPADGSAWESGGSSRIFRGGSWLYYARDCRSANRNYYIPDFRNYDLGFRLLQET